MLPDTIVVDNNAIVVRVDSISFADERTAKAYFNRNNPKQLPPMDYASMLQRQTDLLNRNSKLFLDIIAEGNAAWSAIHSAKDWTEEDLLEWEKIIPNFGCGCKSFYRDYKAANPPTYDENGHLKFEWGCDLHNAVNAKLERRLMPIAEAIALWRPETLAASD